MTTIAGVSIILDEAAQKRRADRSWWMAYSAVLGVSLVVAAMAVLTAPKPFSLAALVLLVVVAAIVHRPERGLWMVAFFALAGDSVTSPWFPFAKNFSSRESILFVSNALIVNPIELCLGAAYLGWVLRMAATRQWQVRRGALFRPVLAFTVFVFIGLLWGLSRGGDVNVALWESRPFFYVAGVYILAVNLLTDRKSYRALWIALLAGVVVDSLLAIWYYRGLSVLDKSGLESLGEHSAATHANVYFILLAALWVFKARAPRYLAMLVVVFPVVGFAYIIGQRRSAFVCLGVASIMLAALLFRFRRRAFWCTIPLLAILSVGYVGAFWNSTSSLAFPAQSVKTVVAPGSLSEKDKSSDLYRKIETFNIVFTIKTAPVTGLGFGHAFYRPLPLADISTFIWQAYITHNSIHWVWMNMGVGGFLSMLYLFGAAIRAGTRQLMKESQGLDAALLATAVMFVVMYAIYAYVDIAWDVQSMVILGSALAHVGSASVPAPAVPYRRSSELDTPLPELTAASR